MTWRYTTLSDCVTRAWRNYAHVGPAEHVMRIVGPCARPLAVAALLGAVPGAVPVHPFSGVGYGVGADGGGAGGLYSGVYGGGGRWVDHSFPAPFPAPDLLAPTIILPLVDRRTPPELPLRDVRPASVPEPGTMVLLAGVVVAVAVGRWVA